MRSLLNRESASSGTGASPEVEPTWLLDVVINTEWAWSPLSSSLGGWLWPFLKVWHFHLLGCKGGTSWLSRRCGSTWCFSFNANRTTISSQNEAVDRLSGSHSSLKRLLPAKGFFLFFFLRISVNQEALPRFTQIWLLSYFFWTSYLVTQGRKTTTTLELFTDSTLPKMSLQPRLSVELCLASLDRGGDNVPRQETLTHRKLWIHSCELW